MDKHRLKNISDITQLVARDFAATNQIILHELKSDVVLVNQLGQYIIAAGGKRLRPLLVLVASKALNYQGVEHHKVAAIIEFIHTATLLHDDVVDESERRRGKQTANTLFGNAASVLVGDFLYSRSFQMMVSLENMQIMQILADATNKIAEGEVLQLMNCNDPDASEQSYFQVIHYKTAILFAAACELAAVISKQPELQQPMREFGISLGLAFQLMDDALDYTADSQALGKNVGDDLAEGKPTLPLIYAKQKASTKDRKLIEQCIKNGGIEHLQEIQQIIEDTDAINYTIKQAKQKARQAKQKLQQLTANPFSEALILLADLAVERQY